MISNNLKKAAVVASVVLAASPAFASVAFGYGGGGGGISSGGSIVVGGSSSNPLPGQTTTDTTTTVTTPAPVGEVLGAETYTFTKNLWKGEHDADVVQLQTFLVAEGYSIPDAVTNYFGSETFAAVKAFQTANGIPSTGFVGPLTRAALNKGIVPKSE